MGVTELRREERSPTSRVETIGKSPDTRHHPLSNGRGHASGHGSVRVNGRASAHGNVMLRFGQGACHVHVSALTHAFDFLAHGNSQNFSI